MIHDHATMFHFFLKLQNSDSLNGCESRKNIPAPTNTWNDNEHVLQTGPL